LADVRQEEGADGGRTPRRRRDPSVTTRAIEAVLALYRDFGLARLSFDQVARLASVGKAALYSRWSSVEELLIDGLATVAPPPDIADHGSLRSDLRQLALILIDLYSGEHGRVVIRIMLDGSGSPAIRPHFDRLIDAYVSTAARIVTRGIDRGELDPDHDPSLLLAQMFGGVMIHVLFFTDPNQRMPRTSASLLADRFVDAALAGISR
jgi:AcrR family transcriptional regulator